MILKTIILLLAILIVSSCQSGSHTKPEQIDIFSVPQIPVEEELLCSLPDLLAPSFHLLNDTLLCLLKTQDASSIRIFRTSNKKIDQYTLKKKDTSIVISPDNHLNAKLDYLNPANNVYYELTVAFGRMSITDFIRLRLGKLSPVNAFKVDENIFVGLGPFSKGLLSIYNSDKQSKEMVFTGNFPIAGQEYQYKEYLDAFQGHLSKYDNQFVYASTYFGYIASYSYNKKKLTKQWEKQTSDFLFQKEDKGIKFDSLHHKGFGCITVGKKHIYAFSQYLSKEKMKENGILVFNRNGELLSCLRIKNPVVFLQADSKEDYLYTISYNLKEQQLYLYRLKLVF